MGKILIMGDVHADWYYLNKTIEEQSPDMILQCGDFGIWPDFENWSLEDKISNKSQIYFCDGNHENHDYLDSLKTDRFSSIPMNDSKTIHYMPRGSTLTLPDGRTVMFFGGAHSIDKDNRTPGLDWFHQELITANDLNDLPDIKVDIIITHTLPEMCFEYIRRYFRGLRQYQQPKFRDASSIWLNILYNQYRPSKWYFGHWHKYLNFTHEGTQFVGLSMPDLGEDWWEVL